MMWIAKLGFCLMASAFALYLYINAHNHLIEIQLAIPPLQKKIREVVADNGRLQFEIDRFESPAHLMHLVDKPEYSHLKPVFLPDILIVHPDRHEN